MPSSVGYRTNFPPSSHAAVPTPTLAGVPFLTASSAVRSNSRSTANLLPNSIESSLLPAVPACCISCVAVRLSSYWRWRRPERKLKVVRRSSGRERMAKDSPVGERVRETGVDFVCSTQGVSRVRSVGGGRGRPGAPFCTRRGPSRILTPIRRRRAFQTVLGVPSTRSFLRRRSR